MSIKLFSFNEKCDHSLSDSFCLIGNICGWISSIIWLIVLLPQLIKNHKERSIFGLSLLWALLNFLASYVNVFFVFQNSLPLFTKISAIYMPVIEMLILFQFFLYSKIFQESKNFIGLLFILFLLFTLILNLLFSKYYIDYLEWISILLWSIETIPQIYLNFINKSTQGLSNISQIICLIGKTSDIIQQYFLDISSKYKYLAFFSTSTAYIVSIQILYYNKEDVIYEKVCDDNDYEQNQLDCKYYDKKNGKKFLWKFAGILLLIIFLIFTAIGLLLRTENIYFSIGSIIGIYFTIGLIWLYS